MRKHYFANSWLLGLSLVIFATANTVWAQAALERLEQQIRQRVGQNQPPPPPQPDVASPNSPAPGMKPALSAENAEPGYLGVLADDRQDRGRGVRVLEVNADGPAAKGGLKKQDLITSVAGVRIRQMTDLSDVMNLYAAGESVALEVLRDNQPQKVKVTLGRRPPQKTSRGPASEAIPLPPGETIPQEPPFGEGLVLKPPQQPSNDTSPPSEAKKPLTSNTFKLKTELPGERGIAEPGAVAPVTPPPPKPNAGEDRPTLEQLQKRIEQLERRVAELEKELKESKK